MQKAEIQFPAYYEAGSLIFPEITIPITLGKRIGVYTEPKKAQQILTTAKTDRKHDVQLKTDGLYPNLTVKEHVQFFKQIYGSTETVENLMRQMGLENMPKVKVKELNQSEYQLLHFIKFLVNDKAIFILEEPLQNMDDAAKQIIVQLLANAQERMVLMTSSNLQDLLISCNEVYRIDAEGLKLLDLKQAESPTEAQEETIEIRIDKVPTKKNDKIILFNPPEIDYIESVEGEVSVYVSGEAYPCALTLTELEKRLVPLGFFRCHRSYIVNLQKVREIITWTRNSYSLSIHTATKATVPLSKSKLPVLKKLIGI